jgi:hypothetical protein
MMKRTLLRIQAFVTDRSRVHRMREREACLLCLWHANHVKMQWHPSQLFHYMTRAPVIGQFAVRLAVWVMGGCTDSASHGRLPVRIVAIPPVALPNRRWIETLLEDPSGRGSRDVLDRESLDLAWSGVIRGWICKTAPLRIEFWDSSRVGDRLPDDGGWRNGTREWERASVLGPHEYLIFERGR